MSTSSLISSSESLCPSHVASNSISNKAAFLFIPSAEAVFPPLSLNFLYSSLRSLIIFLVKSCKIFKFSTYRLYRDENLKKIGFLSQPEKNRSVMTSNKIDTAATYFGFPLCWAPSGVPKAVSKTQEYILRSYYCLNLVIYFNLLLYTCHLLRMSNS